MNTNRTRTVRRSVAALLFAGLAIAGMTACDPHQPADCTKDCLDVVAASPAGDTMSIYGTGAITAEVTIYRDAARTQVVGYARTFAPTLYAQGLPITKAYQGLPLENPARVYLDPARTYYYKGKASGALNKVWNETGSFKTQQRTVTLKLTTINLFGDSDSTGAGEITFYMRANGTNASKVLGPSSLSTGWYSDKLAVTKVIKGGGVTNTVEVRGYDDDCEFSTCTLADGTWGKGSNGDIQWDTAKATITVPYKYGTGTWTATAGKSGSVGDLLDIGFTASGTWTVSYGWD